MTDGRRRNRAAGVLFVALVSVASSACTSTSGHRGTATPTAPATVATTPSASPPTSAAPSSAPSAPAPGPLVVLNPGHNGQDAAHADVVDQLVPSGFGQRKPCETTGTATESGYAEHAFNFDVAIRVRAILTAAGVRVRLTRPDDTGVGPCVDRRAADGNAADVAAVVSIHADGAPAAGHGFHVSQDARAPAGPAVDAESRALGAAIHAALVAGSGLVPSTYIGTDGYFYRTDLAALNLATRPATFLELGNMKNAGDAAEQVSPVGRARIAAAVAAGILAYLREEVGQ